jgi:hypothetical protein
MVHRDVEAILINGVSSHGLVGPPTFPFGLILFATLNFVLYLAEVTLELLDHLFSVPQLLQCIVCEVHRLFDPSHLERGYVKRIIFIVSFLGFHCFAEVQLQLLLLGVLLLGLFVLF